MLTRECAVWRCCGVHFVIAYAECGTFEGYFGQELCDVSWSGRSDFGSVVSWLGWLAVMAGLLVCVSWFMSVVAMPGPRRFLKATTFV